MRPGLCLFLFLQFGIRVEAVKLHDLLHKCGVFTRPEHPCRDCFGVNAPVSLAHFGISKIRLYRTGNDHCVCVCLAVKHIHLVAVHVLAFGELLCQLLIFFLRHRLDLKGNGVAVLIKKPL